MKTNFDIAWRVFVSSFIFLIGIVPVLSQSREKEVDTTQIAADTLLPYNPTKQPTFQPNYRFGDPFSNRTSRSPLLLNDPSNLDFRVEFDSGVSYSVYEKINQLNFRPASTMSFSQFDQYTNQQIVRDYWRETSAGLDGESAVSGRRLIPKLYINPVFDRIFGGSYIDIQPTGFVNLDFGGRWQYVDNPQVPERQRQNGGFAFDMQLSTNVVGKVGEKLAVNFNYDNNNTFDFQNNMKIEYTGYEEEIIKKIEIGNVSMPVSNSLITGAQSLFGIKTQLQFGKLFVTGVMSRQQGRNEVLTVESGFQGQEFEVRSSDYDENRHFFLSHFFRDNYEKWLSGIPQIISGVNVTRVEVYVVNRSQDTRTTRNFVALLDLGEGNTIYNPTNPNIGFGNQGPASNDANGLYDAVIGSGVRDVNSIPDLFQSLGLNQSADFVMKTSARKLELNEYTINKELGYISLLRKLQNDEVLAVSYQYTFGGESFYQVGELQENYQGVDDDEVIFLKMLRPDKIDTRLTSWDLMMKNIYNLNASQVERDGFTLRIHYRDDRTGIDNPSLHEGRFTKDKPLIELLGLDQLNRTNDKQKDGNFDFIDGITIDVRNGNIIFPVLEPFGATLKSYFESSEGTLIEKYVFDTLYATTKADAELVTAQNKYFIQGKFNAGSSSEIVLPGINIAENSVVVTAGNTPLQEGVDYSVDYYLGRVRILNDGILNSGKSIQISYEKADLFNFQTRWLSGARFDYIFNDRFNVGGTVLHLNERRGGRTRFSIGDEPAKNTKYGFDINYQEDSRFLTKLVDALPLVTTKENSSVTFNAEFAQIVPGTSNIIQGEGTSYIDDFETAVNPIGLGNWASWTLAATPETPENKFDLSGQLGDPLGVNHRKAKIAWYTIDNSVFYRSTGNTLPDNINEEDLRNHYVRAVLPQEIFRQRDRTLVATNEPVFDVAYFPSERGQYNYNPNLTQEGLLPDPKLNWGGITRPVTHEVDFEKTNVEYIEFWLMDPFIGHNDNNQRGRVIDGIFNQPNSTGGELIFNLGNVSEDLMKDNQHSFENGLPANGDSLESLTNQWGRVPTNQYLTNYFENTKSARKNQDVGLDGLSNESEQTFFQNYLDRLSVNPQVLEQISEDPSADDFSYYLGKKLDEQKAEILQRYKDYNGLDGNSPVNSGGLTRASTTQPDNEDLNRDNTVSSLEAYYEYKINLKPGELDIGNENIVDKVTDQSGEATWYLFRVPIRSPFRTVNAIDGFKTIRYVRMYLTGFEQPVVLRMANFRMIGSQWRKYQEALNETGFKELPEIETSDFQVSVVNIEENSVGSEGKSPYVIPPGLDRDRDNTTFLNRFDNEQSLQICVDRLDDKDARAVYRNVNYDLINYGRLKMFFHAESNLEGNVQDDEMSAFLRFGTDFTDNYYEIEVPLKITPDNLEGSGESVRRLIWPLENEIDISIDEILGLKSERNRNDVNVLIPYKAPSLNGRYQLTVKGRPDISSIQMLMIGVRNPESINREAHSICIWANELRVTDFNSEAGWATNARLSAKLADLGNITASTRYVSTGFGSIQQRIAERTRQETFQYDISANINLHKFMVPHKTGLQVPMFVSYENSKVTPQYDPLDPDVPLEASLKRLGSDKEKDKYRRLVEERSTRRSINFTNVKKNKVKQEAVSHVWDIENFSFSYAYSDQLRSNVNTHTYLQKNANGGVAYNYAPPSFSIKPFEQTEIFESPYLKLIKDINFSPLPSNVSVRADLNRNFTKTQLYNDQLEPDPSLLYFERLFTFNRNYSLRWNIFQSLSLDYNARANAVIDEPDDIIEGGINTSVERDYIWEQIKGLGRLKTFDQTMSANYKLPFDKLPFTDWFNSDYRVSVGYGWTAASTNQVDSLEFMGHFLQNSRDQTITGKINMDKLYNKVTFLKKANTPTRASSRSRNSGQSDESEKKDNKYVNGVLRTLMAVKSINVTYNIRESTNLSGFTPTPFLLGIDSGFNAPGWNFILGSQNPDIRYDLADNGWMTKSVLLTSPFTQSYSTDISVSSTIEPFKDLKVSLNAERTNTAGYQEIFRYDTAINQHRSLTPSRNGNYRISFLAINTAFENQPKNRSGSFDAFYDNIGYFYDKLNQRAETEGIGYYDTLSQDILVPAFLAAYSGRNVIDQPDGPFPKIPLPNWRVDYAGLSKFPFISDYISSINLTHGYSSSYNVGNYNNSPYYTNNIGLENNILDYPEATQPGLPGEALVPVYVINQVTISEQFTPLIGINIRTKTNLTARFEFKRDRNLSLNLTNAQITETQNKDFSFDIGYTKDNFKLPFKIQGRTVAFDNDISFRMNMSIRDGKTLQRKLPEQPGEESEIQITNGNKNLQFRPTMAYKLNNQLDLMMYFERSTTKPLVGSFNRSTTAFGFQLRFSLTQ